MNVPRVLYHMARADFLERVRRYSFLLILAGALYFAYAVATEKLWVVVGHGYRGVYNSAWIGMLMTICCTTFLSLAGFYIVKNSLQRDSDTRVGRVLAATPMRKTLYTLAKTLSNFAVLACVVLILMLAALVMQILRTGVRDISLWQLWAPFVFVALPAMFVTASLAVLFETLPILRGGVGNVLYFFLWIFEIVLGDQAHVDDPSGIQLLYRSTREALAAVDPSTPGHFNFELTIGGMRATRTFVWNGIDWTPHVIAVRLLWVAIGGGLALFASIFFHRFDPAKESFRRRPKTEPAGSPQPALEQQPAAYSAVISISAGHLTPLVRTSKHLRFPQLVVSELRLMLKGQPWWWYTVAAGLLIAELASPLSAARQGVLLAAWIWPLLIWSQMGCREARHATGPLLFSSEGALTRQLPALWTAGVAVAAFTGGGVGVRLLLTSNWQGLAAWISAAMFIPSLALALGIWSGSSIPFEALYTAWWYVGPGHQLPSLDFIGTTLASSRPQAYALAAAVLLAISYVGRRTRLGYA
jgi:hypothetical protein